MSESEIKAAIDWLDFVAEATKDHLPMSKEDIESSNALILSLFEP